MKSLSRRIAWIASVLTLAGTVVTLAVAAGGGERGPVRRAAAVAPAESEARVIVKFRADSSLMRALSAHAAAPPPQHAQELSARLGLTLRDGRPIGARAQVLTARGLGSRELADLLAAQSDVEYAVVDGRMRALGVPNDPLYPNNLTGVTPAAGQWYLRAPTSSTIVDATSIVSAINAQAAWDVSSGSGVVVAALDTGVRFDHPDLTLKLLAGYDFISVAGNAGDGDGRDADASDPGDYVTQADVDAGVSGCTQSDVGSHSSWHGTQTAGLIGAATDNGIGMAGTGRDLTLLPVRVLGKCGGYDSDIQAAMLWAAGLSASPVVNANPVKVVNLSLGSAVACSAAYKDVVQQLVDAGVVVVAAAGNEGLAVGSPANCPGVLAVAGVRHAGTKVGYSDLGPEIAIAAPAGNCVNLSGSCLYPLLTTSNGGTTTPVVGAAGATYTSGGADASLGTSFSAPLVSGSVGLMLAAHPALKPSQILRALKSTARTFPSSGAPNAQRVTGGPFLPVPTCSAPSSTAQDYECYCTTTTCGAGLLDAGAATAAAPMVAAAIRTASTNVVVGAPVVLDGLSNSGASEGATISGFDWTISGGTAPAKFTSAANASTATLVASGIGNVTVSLTVTDSAGLKDTTSLTLSVGAAPAPAPVSSSGGGALGLGWLLGCLAAVVGVRAVTPRRRAA